MNLDFIWYDKENDVLHITDKDLSDPINSVLIEDEDLVLDFDDDENLISMELWDFSTYI